MAEVTAFTWHPDRTQPTEASATLQVDFSDNTQALITAESDVSSQPALVQQLCAVLFPQGE
jgi:hypothetical protein